MHFPRQTASIRIPRYFRAILQLISQLVPYLYRCTSHHCAGAPRGAANSSDLRAALLLQELVPLLLVFVVNASYPLS